MAQNNGVIEEHQGGGGVGSRGRVSLCIACCRHHHPADDHCGWRLQRAAPGPVPPRRHGRDLIQLQNSPTSFKHPTCVSTPSLTTVSARFVCVCLCARVVSQWSHVCVCMDGSHHDSERTGLSLQGRTGGKGQMIVCENLSVRWL